MSPQEWAALVVSITTIVAVFSGSVKWLVKHYLSELKPNSGSSIKDQVNRLEDKTDKLEEKIDKMSDMIIMNFLKDRNK
jgi:cell division protein FtsX